MNLWLHLPAGSTGSAASRGKTGAAVPGRGQGRCKGSAADPQGDGTPCPHAALSGSPNIREGLEAARKRVHLLRWEPASSPPLFFLYHDACCS